MLLDHDFQRRVPHAKVPDNGHEGAPDGGGEPRHTQRPARLGRRVQVQPGTVDRSKGDGGVLGKPPPGGCEPDAAPVRLEEAGAGFPGEQGDLLRHWGGGGTRHVGHGPHGAAAGKLEGVLQPSCVHDKNCSLFLNQVACFLAWT